MQTDLRSWKVTLKFFYCALNVILKIKEAETKYINGSFYLDKAIQFE